MAAMLAAFARLVRERPAGAAPSSWPAPSTRNTPSSACKSWSRSRRAGRLRPSWPSRRGCKSSTPTRAWCAGGCGRPGRSCHSSRPGAGRQRHLPHGAESLAVVEEYAERLRAARADPLLGPATLSVGRIEGGVSVNTVPDECRHRDRPPAPARRTRGRGAGPISRRSSGRTRGSTSPRRSIRRCSRARRLAATGRTRSSVGSVWLSTRWSGRTGSNRVPFGTDASTIAEAGIPAVVFGPGDIAQAHTRDEWIELGAGRAGGRGAVPLGGQRLN